MKELREGKTELRERREIKNDGGCEAGRKERRGRRQKKEERQ